MILLSMFSSVKLSSSSSFMLGLFLVSIPLSISMRVMGEMAPGWCFFVVSSSKLSDPEMFSSSQYALTSSDSSGISTVAYNANAVAQNTSSCVPCG